MLFSRLISSEEHKIGYNDYQLWILTIIATVAIIIISPIDSEKIPSGVLFFFATKISS